MVMRDPELEFKVQVFGRVLVDFVDAGPVVAREMSSRQVRGWAQGGGRWIWFEDKPVVTERFEATGDLDPASIQSGLGEGLFSSYEEC